MVCTQALHTAHSHPSHPQPLLSSHQREHATHTQVREITEFVACLVARDAAVVYVVAWRTRLVLCCKERRLAAVASNPGIQQCSFCRRDLCRAAVAAGGRRGALAVGFQLLSPLLHAIASPCPGGASPLCLSLLFVVVSVHTSPTFSTLVFCLQQFAHKDARFLHVWALRISESTPPGALRSLHTAAADLLAACSLPMQMHRKSNRRKRGVSFEKILILCDALPLFFRATANRLLCPDHHDD